VFAAAYHSTLFWSTLTLLGRIASALCLLALKGPRLATAGSGALRMRLSQDLRVFQALMGNTLGAVSAKVSFYTLDLLLRIRSGGRLHHHHNHHHCGMAWHPL